MSYKVKKTLIYIKICIALICSGIFCEKIINKYRNSKYEEVVDVNTITNYINDSRYLTNEEKEYLCNSNFINDMINYDSDINFLNSVEYERFKNLDIIRYNNIKDSSKNANVVGYYDGDNKIHVKNYDDKNVSNYSDVVAHEFVHMFQCNKNNGKYLNEALAEIISCEYFDCKINSYIDNTINVRILIDLIGTDPLINYMLTGNYDSILNSLNKYLNEDESIKLINIFNGNTNYDSDNEKDNDIKSLLKKAYENVNSVERYNYLNDGFTSGHLIKYYFNSEKLNDEIYDSSSSNNEEFSLKDAYNYGMVGFYLISDDHKLIDNYDSSIDYYVRCPIINSIDIKDNNLIITKIECNSNIGEYYKLSNIKIYGTYNGNDYNDSLINAYLNDYVDIYCITIGENSLTYEEYEECSNNNIQCIVLSLNENNNSKKRTLN